MRAVFWILIICTFAVPVFAGTYDSIAIQSQRKALVSDTVKEKKCYDEACKVEKWVQDDLQAQNGHIQSAFRFKWFSEAKNEIIKNVTFNVDASKFDVDRRACQQAVSNFGLNGLQCGTMSGKFTAKAIDWTLGNNGKILNASGQTDSGLGYNISSNLYSVFDERSGRKVVFRISNFDINQAPTVKSLKDIHFSVIEANLPQAVNQMSQYLNKDGGSNFSLNAAYKVINNLWQGYAEVNSGTAFDFANLMITDPDTTNLAIKEYFRTK